MNKGAILTIGVLAFVILIAGYFLLTGERKEEAATPYGDDYVVYEDDQYDYSFVYPRNFAPQTDVSDPEMRVFAQGGTEIRVFGVTNTEERTLESIARTYVESNDEYTLDAEASGSGTVVLRGFRGSIKAIDVGNDQVAVLVVTGDEGALVAEEVEIMLESFTPENEDVFEEDVETLGEVFGEELTQEEAGEPMPIEGYSAALLMERYPGLVAADFEGVQTFQGHYTTEDGELTFVLVADTEHSASTTVSDEGFQTLLQNVAERLDMSVETEADVEAVVEAISS